MIPYASNTGTRRNLAALRAAGWRIMLTPANPKWRDGFKCCIENGAWSAYQTGQPFDEKGFLSLVDAYGSIADFVIVPDIVAGGMKSLEFSLSWLPRLRHLPNLLLPVQDGMTPADVGSVLSSWTGLGIFLGGSTEWKLQTLYGWGMVPCHMKPLVSRWAR